MSTNINITIGDNALLDRAKQQQSANRQAQLNREASTRLEAQATAARTTALATQGRDATGNPITGASFTQAQFDRRPAANRPPSGKAEMAIAFVAEADWRDGEDGANRSKWFICSGDCSAVIDLADVLNLDLAEYGDTRAFFQSMAPGATDQPSFCHVYPFASRDGEQCMMVHIGMNQRLARDQNLTDAQVLLSIGPNWIKTVPLAGKTLPSGYTGNLDAQTTFIGGNYGFIGDKAYRYAYGWIDEANQADYRVEARWNYDGLTSGGIIASGSPLSWNTAEIPGTNVGYATGNSEMDSHLTIRAWMQANLQEWRVMAPKFCWFIPGEGADYQGAENDLDDYWEEEGDPQRLDIFSYAIIPDPFNSENDVSLSQPGPEVTTDETLIKYKTIPLSLNRLSLIRSLPNMNWNSGQSIDAERIIVSSTYGANQWCRSRLLAAGFLDADLAP
jgi:hypothetical protein